jgi:tetratricopeptide (TPR) repeat protein
VLAALALVVSAGAFGWSVSAHRRAVAGAEWWARLPPAPAARHLPAGFGEADWRLREAIRLGRDPERAVAELAMLYHANGFLVPAGLLYAELIQRQPDQARWFHLLSAVAQAQGDLARGIRLSEAARVRVRGPAAVPVSLRLADLYHKTGDFERAAAVWREVLRLAPANPYALLGLARLDILRGDHPAAREKLEAAVRTDPRFCAGHNLLVSLYEIAGLPALAAAAKERGEAANRYVEPPDPWLEALHAYTWDTYRLDVLAAIAFQTGRLDAARPLLDRGLAIAPDDADLLVSLGSVQRTSGDHAGARATLERVLATDPANEVAALELGEALRTAGDFSTSERVHRAALEHNPESPKLHHGLALALEGQGRLAAALAAYRVAAERGPAQLEIAFNYALALTKAGRPVAAAAELDRLLAMNPRDGAAHAVRGELALERDDFDRAKRHLRRALELAPEFPRIGTLNASLEVRRGNRHATAGRYDDALGHYRRALEFDAGFPDALANAGIALLRLGRLAEAITSFERMVQVAPENPVGFLYLGQALIQQGDERRAREILQAGQTVAHRSDDLAVAEAIARLLAR